jgi:hypothetical protein
VMDGGLVQASEDPSGFAFAAAQTEWAGVLSLSATQLGSRCSPRASVSSRSAQTSPFRAAPRRSRTAASKHNCLQSVRSLQAQKGGRARLAQQHSAVDGILE